MVAKVELAKSNNDQLKVSLVSHLFFNFGFSIYEMKLLADFSKTKKIC